MEKNLEYYTYPYDVCSLEPNWWLFGMRGLLSIIFGGLAMFMPIATVLIITIVFGIYSIIDGIFNIISGINQARRDQQWGELVFSGSFGVIVGLAVLITPHVASLGLTAFLWSMFSIWAIAAGILAIAASIRLRLEIPNEKYLALSGIFFMMEGIGMLLILWFYPMTSLVILGMLVGFNSIVSGIALLLLAYKLFKRLKNSPPSPELLEPTHMI